MLQIIRGATNTLIVTATEKVTLANPVFLFRFVSEGGMNVEQSAILSNSSTYTDRYDKFTFTEGVDLTLTSGIWDYYIYEQTSPTNTDYRLSDTLEPLEVGRAKVTGAQQTNIVAPQTTTNVTW